MIGISMAVLNNVRSMAERSSLMVRYKLARALVSYYTQITMGCTQFENKKRSARSHPQHNNLREKLSIWSQEVLYQPPTARLEL